MRWLWRAGDVLLKGLCEAQSLWTISRNPRSKRCYSHAEGPFLFPHPFFFISLRSHKWKLARGLERSVASLVRLEALLSSLSVQFLKLHTREAFHVCQSADDFGHVSLALSSRVGRGPTFDVPFGGTLCSLVEGTWSSNTTCLLWNRCGGKGQRAGMAPAGLL